MNLAELFTPQARTFVQTGWGAPPASPIPLISIAYGLADPALFPREELIEATAQVLASDMNAALNYGPSDPALRELIVERLRRDNVAADADRVLVLPDHQQQVRTDVTALRGRSAASSSVLQR
jgi:DNA-binding transcriptional MocR family regulator